MILSFQVDELETIYKIIQKRDIPIVFELTKEEWGQEHFGILDPNKIPIDIVKYTE